MNSEKQIGIETFLTKDKGIGGKLRVNLEDFIVEEISVSPNKENGKYTIVKIRAKNWETFKLINEISKKLKVSRNRINFAGTKDKRAIKTQLISIKDSIEKVLQLDIQDVEILDAYTSSKKIDVGDLLGNKFHVVIREIKMEKNEAKEIVENISNQILDVRGFPNFFGVQRFGILRPISHIVGKNIIKKNFKEAVFTFIGNPMENEDKEVIKARKFVEETEDFNEVLKFYPKYLNFERAMMHYLKNHPSDYCGSFNKLPKNLTKMFVHAYQSYIFNRILSERMKKGIPINEPIIGDICLPIEKNGLPNRKELIEVDESNFAKIRKKVKEGKAIVSAILFGYEPEFAKGEQGEIERKIIEEERVNPNDFIIPKIEKLSSKGIRREILAPLKKIDWKVDNYVELKFQLIKGCYATSLLREFMKCKDLMCY